MNLVTSGAITMSSRYPSKIKDQRRRSGCVYIIEFENGIIKVGQSRAPAKRLKTYSVYCSHAATNISKEWVSPILENAKLEESRMIEACLEFGSRAHGREWFSGVSFDDLRAHTMLFMEIASDEYLAEEVSRANKAAEKFVSGILNHFHGVNPRNKSGESK